jgi:hypothetical protein
MKRISCLSLLALIFLAILAPAQTRTSGGGRPTGGVTTGTTPSRPPNSINVQPTPLFV